jgi:hypothetical protein
VAGIEELELHVGDADAGQRVPEGHRSQVQEPLVSRTGVDPDRLETAQRVGKDLDHAHRVPIQPALPDLGTEDTAMGIERQGRSAVGLGREAGRDAEHHQEQIVVRLGERHPALEVPPPGLEVPVPGPECPHSPGELVEVAELVEGVAGVRSQSAEEVGAEHRRDHGPEAAARLALNAPVGR